MKKLKADLVILHPDFNNSLNCKASDYISLSENVQPDLTKSLKLSFQIADNVVLILHKKCDIT